MQICKKNAFKLLRMAIPDAKMQTEKQVFTLMHVDTATVKKDFHAAYAYFKEERRVFFG